MNSGCGKDKDKKCVHQVEDSNRDKATSDYVSRFTFDKLAKANRGTRFPEKSIKCRHMQ